MNAADHSSLHRHLDEAFAGIPMTPEVQDLKEEIRGNLSSRVDELVAGGATAAAAVGTAIAELGDIRSLVASLDDTADPLGAARLNRVRLSPAFVVVATFLSLVLAASVTLVVATALALSTPVAGYLGAAIGALAIAVLVGLALRQETSQHYPLPLGRAVGFGVASGVGLLGLAGVGLFFTDPSAAWLLIAGIAAAVASVLAFIWLGVTQTNRTKPWALELQRTYEASDPFATNPALAARFGIYTVVIFLVTLTVFVVLSFTIGFVWSWLAVIAGLVVFFLTLANLMFGTRRNKP